MNRNWQSASLSCPPDLRSQALRSYIEGNNGHDMKTKRRYRAHPVRTTRAGSLDVGEALCHPILTKIGIVVNSFWCTICIGGNRPRICNAVPSLSPLVRQPFELSLLPHSHPPTPTDRASVSGTDACIGVIKLATSITGTEPRAEVETAR